MECYLKNALACLLWSWDWLKTGEVKQKRYHMKSNRDKEGGRRIEDLGHWRRGSKIGRGSKEVS